MQADGTFSALMVKVLKVATAVAGSEPLTMAEVTGIIDGIVAEAAREGLGEPETSAVRTRLLGALKADDGRVYEVMPSLCSCGPGEAGCQGACVVGAIGTDEDGKAKIDQERCIACGLCLGFCKSGAIAAKSACIDLVNILREVSRGRVYAILAPSFAGQFGERAKPAELRLALRRLGFTDIAEVALAADVVTVMEAQEYVERMDAGGRFMITSCCCPAFVKLVARTRPEFAHLVSHSVSPMVACARLIKATEVGARVVFIGPCLAKRAEAREEGLAGAVDLVLTFKELSGILDAAGINPAEGFRLKLPDLSDASHDGRIYARTGGVTEAISRAVHHMRPDLEIVAVKGDGIKECSALLERLGRGENEANFMEGMGCPGGCIGGPGTLLPREGGARCANAYADASPMRTAHDNQHAQEWYSQHEEVMTLKVPLREPREVLP